MAKITKSEWAGWDQYIGLPEDLIEAGIVRADQLPGVGDNRKTSVTFVQGKRMARGQHYSTTDETYLQVQLYGGKLKVRVGVSLEVQEARLAACQAALKAENLSEREAKQREVMAAKAKYILDEMPQSADEFKRSFVKTFLGWLNYAAEKAGTANAAHGYRFDEESIRSILMSADAVVEAIMQSSVDFDADSHLTSQQLCRATIAAADQIFQLQLSRLAVPQPEMLKGEAA